MNGDDSEAASGENIPSNNLILTPEKTCSKLKDASIISNASPLSPDLNQSVTWETENNTNNCTDSTLNSTVSPKASGKSKRKSGGKKHRAGRNRKRKWKPYHKLTWEEKQKLDERNARRAQRVRDEMSAVGIPVAPYNTSQFLINDYLSCHVIKTPDFEDMHNGHEEEPCHSEDSSEEHYHPCSDDIGAYYQRAFLEDYANIHEEYLNSLSQFELAEEWVNLEDKIDVVEKQLKELREQRTTMGLDAEQPHAEMEKIEVFRVEIQKLFNENHDLESQNEKLRKLLSANS